MRRECNEVPFEINLFILVAMGRSRSTPGLVESKGKVPVSDIHKNELTSASTATLVADDDPEKQRCTEGNAEMGDTESTGSADAGTNMKGSMKGQPCDANIKMMNAQYSPMLTAANQSLIYPPHLLSPNIALINFDNRAQQSSMQPSLYPSPQMPYYSTSHTQQYSPYCNLSPAVSTNHLSVPTGSVGIATPTPSNFVSEDNSTSIAVNNQSQDALLSEIKRLRERLLTLETENASMSMKLNQQQWQVENR